MNESYGKLLGTRYNKLLTHLLGPASPSENLYAFLVPRSRMSLDLEAASLLYIFNDRNGREKP